MVTRSQKIRLGLFLTVAAIALIALLVAVLAPRFIQKRETYKIGFSDVSLTGLLEGGTVKYHGLNVGFVSQIYIDPDNIRRVIVEVSLDPATPIKRDTEAEITFLGITGLKVIELHAGSDTSAFLQPGAFIRTGRSITDEITGKAEVIADKAERVLNNIALLTDAANRAKMLTLIDNTNAALAELNDILAKNNAPFTHLMANGEAISSDLQESAASAKYAIKSLRGYAESDSVREIIGNLARFSRTINEADLLKIVHDLNVTLDRTNSILKEMGRRYTESEAEVTATLKATQETLDNLNEFSRQISEDPSILLRGGKPKGIPDYQLEK
ncbi:MAG TPA: MlaD family protein [bacterium]|nr:MlaD family protein [bacterium]HQG44932.1 MlaD family protein [bacterium]HQI49452.1 MlaD family protein [bacterium]HQJ64389.1 MlaD family protein [bacterium]HQJ65501.1 MlaD family protein [bacterium]